MRPSPNQRRFAAPATLLWMVLFTPLSAVRADNALQQAQKFEAEGRWYEACCIYDELLSKDRTQTKYREAYRQSLRHFRQQRRLDDPVLHSMLNKLSVSEAGDLYEQILNKVVRYYAERDRLDPTELLQQGVKEMRESLKKKAMQQRLTPSDIAAFRDTLESWEGERAANWTIAGKQARRIILTASQQGLSPGVVALELACGAANSLDEYSLYLAPSRVSREQALLASKMVGIGVEVLISGQRLEITRVHRKSPAAEQGLMKGDVIVRVDGHEVDPMAPDIAAERLLGEAGTSVELEFIPRGQMMAERLKVKRQTVTPTSVDFEHRGDGKDGYIGYIQIHSFQKSTLQEVKDAMMSWQGMPLKGVIIDLRGNPGGLLDSAVNIAELFFPETVTLGHSVSASVRRLNATFRSNNPTPFLVPLAVLVDGETASAAEMLAGAFKDNQRAHVVGQTTFGKGSVQTVFPLERAPGGLRLTVAKFTTPLKSPVMGRGIVPTTVVSDPDPEVALKKAEFLLRNPVVMMMLQ